jgi:transcriptional regulator with XRE-family HTH domain
VQIGAKIRQRRTEEGLSLQELAGRTELTPSFLSQVERDVAEPSITSLRKIADALDVPIFYFLMGEDDMNPVVRRTQRRVMQLSREGVTYELLSPPDFVNKKMEIVITRMAPGARGGDHPVTHPGEECIVILQGQAEITVGEQRYTLEEGDSIYYYSSIPHHIRNTGEGELRFLGAITPPRF